MTDLRAESVAVQLLKQFSKKVNLPPSRTADLQFLVSELDVPQSVRVSGGDSFEGDCLASAPSVLLRRRPG